MKEQIPPEVYEAFQKDADNIIQALHRATCRSMAQVLKEKLILPSLKLTPGNQLGYPIKKKENGRI